MSEGDSDTHRDGEVLRDAFEVGCGGLVAGWAIQKATGRRVHSSKVSKSDGPFICQGCLSDAIHRHCTEARDHFAHLARLSPIARPGETQLHASCKGALFEHLSSVFPETKWVCDSVRIKADKARNLPELQPDIGGRIEGKRVAIEIQNSTLTVSRILKRCLGYSGRDISILWVVPLREPIGGSPIRPRLFERYLHSIYFGRVYYWLPSHADKILPVHFSPAWAHVEFRQWFSEGGEENEAGGYDRPYKRIRLPMPESPQSIGEAFYHRWREEHRPWNERKQVPRMKILMDNLPIWWNPDEHRALDRSYPEGDGE